MKKYILIIVSAFLVISCAEKAFYVEPGVIAFQKINFTKPAVGQKSKYLFLVGQDYIDTNNTYPENRNYNYFRDTLELVIVDSSQYGYLIKEQIHVSSGVLDDLFRGIVNPERINYYYFRLYKDSLVFHNKGDTLKSNLFMIPYMRLTIGLNGYNDRRIEVKGWKATEDFTGGLLFGYDENLIVLHTLYPRANIIIDERPMLRGSLGRNIIFFERYGMIRNIIIDPYTMLGIGWDLL